MTVIAVMSFVGARALQATFGGTEFLPKSDYGMIAIDIRTAEFDFNRLCPPEASSAQPNWLGPSRKPKATDSNVNAGGGRSLRRSGQEHRAQAIGHRNRRSTCAS